MERGWGAVAVAQGRDGSALDQSNDCRVERNACVLEILRMYLEGNE